MKTKKLLRRIRELLSADKRAQLAKFDSLTKTLDKLKKKETRLREKLEVEEDEERRSEIRHKLKVIAAQRKKGRKLSDELEALRNPDNDED